MLRCVRAPSTTSWRAAVSFCVSEVSYNADPDETPARSWSFSFSQVSRCQRLAGRRKLFGIPTEARDGDGGFCDRKDKDAGAQGIQLLVVHSPFRFWLYHVLSVQAVSNLIGIIEVS